MSVWDTPGEMTYPSTGDEPETIDPDARRFWWRMIGTDIQVRAEMPEIPDYLVSDWEEQVCPTGLLTIHLAGDPTPGPVADPALAPIETPGPTFIRQADWDEETQTWRSISS